MLVKSAMNEHLGQIRVIITGEGNVDDDYLDLDQIQGHLTKVQEIRKASRLKNTEKTKVFSLTGHRTLPLEPHWISLDAVIALNPLSLPCLNYPYYYSKPSEQVNSNSIHLLSFIGIDEA